MERGMFGTGDPPKGLKTGLDCRILVQRLERTENFVQIAKGKHRAISEVVSQSFARWAAAGLCASDETLLRIIANECGVNRMAPATPGIGSDVVHPSFPRHE
jgi:hypothetical protein